MDLRKFTFAHLRVRFQGKRVEKKTNESSSQGLGREKLQSVIYFISLVTCSGLGKGNGDVSAKGSWKQEDSYELYQVLTNTTHFSMNKATARI